MGRHARAILPVVRVCVAVALALVASGCEVTDPVGVGAEGLTDAPSLVFHRRVVEPAPASDQRPLYSLAWRHADGHLEPIDLPPAMHAVAVGGEVYWVDAAHRLHRGEAEVLAEGVFARPIVHDERLVYVQGGAGQPQTIHWRDDSGSGELATGLYQLGALTAAPDGSALLGVGSRNGGVAGVWVVPLDGADARCLSNCDLRIGGDWGEAFVAAPGDATALSFEGDRVRWDTPAGRVEREWRP